MQYETNPAIAPATPAKVGYIFTQNVIKSILNGNVLSSEQNIASPITGNYVVPFNILDSKYNVPYFYPGHAGTIASAAEVYNELIRMTRWLLKVGTYSYSEYRQTDGGSDNHWSSSGAAIFTDSYAASQIGNINSAALTPMPGNGGVVNTGVMSVQSINNLAANCLSSWGSSRRPSYAYTHVYCHSSCHNSCHDSCHSDCNCYCHKNGWGYANGDTSWNCNSNPTIDW